MVATVAVGVDGSSTAGEAVTLAAELAPDPLRQRRDDEVVGVLDHVAHELVGDAPVQRDRVPMTLVEVPAGADRGVAVAERDGEIRLALDADLERRALQPAEGEDLAGDLEHRVLGPEREVLDRASLSEAPGAQLGRIHAPDRRTDGRCHHAGASRARGSAPPKPRAPRTGSLRV